MVEDKEDKNAAQDIIDKAYAAADKLEKENQRSEEILRKLEEKDAQRALENRNILAGHSYAGEPPMPPKPETPQEYARRMLRGGTI